MPTFPATSFEGTLSGDEASVAVNFTAEIDRNGLLQLHLENLPVSQAALKLNAHSRPRDEVDVLSLRGANDDGMQFSSDGFHITHFNHGAELTYQGECDDAEIAMVRNEDANGPQHMRVWHVRQFSTFRKMVRDTELGRVVIAGPKNESGSQEPDGYMAVVMADGLDDEAWWPESERFLEHVARVLSFASDTYFRPVIEERYEPDRLTIRVCRQPRANNPFMAPFHFLHLDPIFECACESYFTRHDQVVALDTAIRWLTAPIAYDENRLVNAISALENILDNAELDGLANYLGNSKFKKIAKQVRQVLRDAAAPDQMLNKVAELNRRSLAEKVETLLAERRIEANDMPEDWLDIAIKQRNHIVHRGFARRVADENEDVLDHTVWVREIVTRIILQQLGFEGGYRSWLHRDRQWHFPLGISMEEWVRRQEQAS